MNSESCTQTIGPKPGRKAFTVIELLVVLALVGMLAVTLLPALASAKGNSQRTTCYYNLKQIGVAFRTWEISHNNRFPMAVWASSGGANEFVSHCSGFASATPGVAGKPMCPGMAFMVMSNELSTPKVLFCPSDNIHTLNNGYATNFSYTDLLGIAAPVGLAKPAAQVGEGDTAGSKISYFVNGDATEANPRDLMTGDDNIGNNGATTASSPTNYRFGASNSANTASIAANGVTSVGISATAFNGSPWWAWTANDFHRKSGNLGMADGSCQFATIAGLHVYLSASTNSQPAEAINFMP